MPALILHWYQIAPGHRVFKAKVQELNCVENFSKYFSIMDFEMSKELYSATKCLKKQSLLFFKSTDLLGDLNWYRINKTGIGYCIREKWIFFYKLDYILCDLSFSLFDFTWGENISLHISKEENGYNYQTVKQKERERIFFLRHTDNWNRVFCHMLHRFFGQLPPFALT